jgi:hypothetical protein
MQLEIPDPKDHDAVYWMIFDFYYKDDYATDIEIERNFCQKFPPHTADEKKRIAIKWLLENKLIDLDETKGYKINILGRRLVEQFFKNIRPNEHEFYILHRVPPEAKHPALGYINYIFAGLRSENMRDKSEGGKGEKIVDTNLKIKIALSMIGSFLSYLAWTKNVYGNTLDLFEMLIKIMQ